MQAFCGFFDEKCIICAGWLSRRCCLSRCLVGCSYSLPWDVSLAWIVSDDSLNRFERLLERFLLLRNILKRFLQQLPERLDRLDESTLRSGVGRLHRGAETHHIEVRILAEDNGTLQSGMVYLDDAILAKEFLVFL